MNEAQLIENSLDVMAALRDGTGFTVGLAVFADDQRHGKVVARQEGNGPVTVTPEIGYAFPLHATAPGKALLAFLSADERRRVIAGLTLEHFTETTITDEAVLHATLEADWERGYSIDVGETAAGVNCVGTAIVDEEGRPLAAIWVTALSMSLQQETFSRHAVEVIRAAGRIADRLQGDGRPRDAYVQALVTTAQRIMTRDLHAPFDAAAFARDHHVSYSWFRRRFQQLTGSGPHQFHLDARMEKAERLLLHTNETVKEIADQLGYQDQNYFSAQFKKKHGQSPTAFRARGKAD